MHAESLVILNTGDGRGASPELIDVADTVSRVENVKHAFQSGIMAKRGIDF